MKNIILIVTTLISTSLAGFSQGPEIGVKTGVNVFNSNPNDALGFYAGVLAEYRVNNAFGVQGELLYSTLREGWLAEYDDHLNSLVLPVMGKWYVTKRLSLDFGPQFGLLLPDNENNEKFDFSLGAGLSYRIGSRFDVSARYNWGLTRIEKGVDGYNNTLRLGVGYRF